VEVRRPNDCEFASASHRHSTISEILTGQIHANQDDLIAAIAGPFHPAVSHIFPDEYQPLYLLTETSRRQVWYACFAANDETSIIQQNPAALRHALVHCSNKELLKRAFGNAPPGFVNALGKMGVSAQKPSVYLALHRLLSSDPSFRHPLSHLKRIDARQIKMSEALGPKFARPNILAILHGGADARAVGAALQCFLDHGLISERDLMLRLRRVKKLGELSMLIDRIYCTIEFPKPPIRASSDCRAICSAEEQARAARRFRNCLRTFIPEVIRGEMYFYVWHGDEPAVIQLRPERPFGWLVNEIWGIQNRTISRDCRDTIQRHFKQAGAHCRPNIERIVRWTLRDDEMDQGLQEVEEGLAEVIAEIEGDL
jgi:hypothetical protein